MSTEKAPLGEAWDRCASYYHRFAPTFTSLHAYDLLSSIVDEVRSAKTILDVACGTGAFCMAYMRMFPKGIPGQTLVMTDVSSEMISLAEQDIRSRLPSEFQTDLQFRTEDATNMKSISDSSIDVLVSCFGIFLIDEKDVVLNEVKRVLKSGGTFATTAWTDLPSGMDFKTPGFGGEFQKSIGEAFNKLRKPDPADKPPVWKLWSEPDAVRKALSEASFARIKVHRTIHSTTFQNVNIMWQAVTTTSPFVDVSNVEPNQLAEVRKALRDSAGVENEDDIVYVVMSSNIIVSVADSPVD